MFGEVIVRVICVYGLQSKRTMTEKQRFYDEQACEQNLKSNAEMALGLGDFNGYIEKTIDGLKVYI